MYAILRSLQNFNLLLHCVTMDNRFENNIEEITQIITRSKKDKNTTFFRIQKSKRLHIHQRDNEITDCHIDTLEGVNMHMLSQEGQLIYGASDRMHLPDVISRLYQSLGNLLKANKGHNVREKITVESLPNESVVKIENIDLAEWDIEYLKETLSRIYSEIQKETQSEASINFHIEGNHSLWLIANSEGGQSQFDDFTMSFKWKLTCKKNPSKSISATKLISGDDLRNKSIDIDFFVRDISENYRLLKTDYPLIPSQDIEPQAVLLHGEISQLFLYNLLRQNHIDLFKKGYTLSDKSDSGLIEEFVCKYGIQLDDTIKIGHTNSYLANTSYFDYTDEKSESNTRISRQYSFYDQVIPHFRNIVLTPNKQAINPEFTIDISNIEDSIAVIKKNLGIKKLLYVTGLTENTVPESKSHAIVSPVIALYSDENKTYSVELNHYLFDKNGISDIQYSGPKLQTVFKLSSNLPFMVESSNLCIIKTGKK